MDTTVLGDETWLRTVGRRVLREYPTVQQMLDDIWRAHEHGWLPLSMTEKSQSEVHWTAPWTWFRKQITYVVAYRHGQR
jgi:hypothetical protein